MQTPTLTMIEREEDGLTHWKVQFPSSKGRPGKTYLALTLRHGTLVMVQSWERRRRISNVDLDAAIRTALAQLGTIR